MAEKTGTGTKISTASTAKRNGRCLQLRFKNDPPHLDRIEFRFDISILKPSFFQRGDQHHPLHWPGVESAISLCFLGYLDWHKSKKTGAFLFGEEPVDSTLAKQLSGAIYQGSHKIHELFYGENPKNLESEPDVTHLVFPRVPGINKSGRNKSKPIMLAISETFLPPDCVEVYWDRDDTGQPTNQLDELTDLRLLAHLIRESQGLPQIPKSQITTNVSPDTVLLSAKAQTMDSIDFVGFDTLTKMLREADGRVLKSIRDHDREFFSEEELAQEHHDLLEISLKSAGLNLPEFLARIQDLRFLERLSQTVIPQLQIRVGDVAESRFASLEFVHEGKVLISLKNVDLLWPCWCRSKISDEKTCPIHSHVRGKEVDNRFSNGLVEIHWRGFRFLWKDGREAWPPSVDAFTFINTLEQEGVFQKPADSCLDVGSGTGFLGIIASHLSENTTKIILWDWLLTPALYGQINWYRNRENTLLHTNRDYVTACPMIALFSKTVQQAWLPAPSDMVLCNPPYLPIPQKFKKLSFASTTSGTVLLEQVISNSRNLGKDVYLQFSKLAMVEARASAKDAGVRLIPVGRSPTVPCRIRDAINNPAYLEFLKQPRRGLKFENRRFTHKICAYQVV